MIGCLSLTAALYHALAFIKTSESLGRPLALAVVAEVTLEGKIVMVASSCSDSYRAVSVRRQGGREIMETPDRITAQYACSTW